jgi:DNA modification methylase
MSALQKILADHSIDLIQTDPPYDMKALPLYEKLASVASGIYKCTPKRKVK